MSSRSWLSLFENEAIQTKEMIAPGHTWRREQFPRDSVDHASGTARISVVIPAYNASAHLAATLRSVFNQTLQPCEVIVVDDGSTDDTVAIARSFDVEIISLANGRVARARNVGTSAATGEYIAYMDADDLWAPDKLAVQYSALRSFGQPAFSFTDYRTFDNGGAQQAKSGLLQLPAFRKTMRTLGKRSAAGHILIADDGKRPVLPDCYILPSSVLVRRADVLAVGGFDETVPVSEDFEFFLRLFKTRPAIVVMQRLLFYRRHAAQQTANQTAFRASAFDIARRVAELPEKYPVGDVRHMAATEFVRHYRLGIEQARRERFDEASRSFELSLGAHFSLRTGLALVGSRACRGRGGHRMFRVIRALWKLRRGLRRTT